MRICYADPPYPGRSYYYGRREVNHRRLIAALVRFDGWALSTSSNKLRDLLPTCPPGTRVAAWTKPYGWMMRTRPAFAWEPVIFCPARSDGINHGRSLSGSMPIVADFCSSAPCRDFIGSKPPEFCGWLFDLLGAEPEDEFHDLFYGSGAVTKAWKQWCQLKRCGGPLFVQDSCKASQG